MRLPDDVAEAIGVVSGKLAWLMARDLISGFRFETNVIEYTLTVSVSIGDWHDRLSQSVCIAQETFMTMAGGPECCLSFTVDTMLRKLSGDNPETRISI